MNNYRRRGGEDNSGIYPDRRHLSGSSDDGLDDGDEAVRRALMKYPRPTPQPLHEGVKREKKGSGDKKEKFFLWAMVAVFFDSIIRDITGRR